MDDKTQVNINRPDRNQIPPWAWAAIAAAALALILGYLLFFNQPQQQPAVTPTVTPTTSVVEVTTTPNLLTPSATPLTVEVTPTAGSPTAADPTATVVVIEVTSTPGPLSATPVVVATVTAAPTTAGQPTAAATTGASPSPQATLTADEQTVMDALRDATNGDRVTTVRFDGTKLIVAYRIVDGGTAESAREQIRAMLVALAGSALNYSKLLLMGSQTAGQEPAAIELSYIELTYDKNTVTTTDWSAVPATDIYGKAETQFIQPPYNTP